MDPMPPSFMNGRRAIERRRERINAAKQRISRIMSSNSAGPSDAIELQPANAAYARKRRRSKKEEVDWEDFIY